MSRSDLSAQSFTRAARRSIGRLLASYVPPIRHLNEALAHERSIVCQLKSLVDAEKSRAGELAERTAELETRVTELEAERSRAARLVERTAELEGRITELETELSLAERQTERVTELEAEISELQARFTPVPVARPPLLFTPPGLNGEQQVIVDRFHQFMYDITDEHAMRSYCVSWLGYGMLKWPTDMWNYQEIIAQQMPDVIVETGTHRGGSALFFATICDLVQKGEVISIDIDDSFRATQPDHLRLTFLSGSSTDPAIVAVVRKQIASRPNVLVILDSDHRRDHVLNELRIYSEFVPVGGYLIVEDTNVNGHPAYPEFGPGPYEAVHQFLAENPHFMVDRNQERFYLTHNPHGFLRRCAR